MTSTPRGSARLPVTASLVATLVVTCLVANPLHEAGHWIGFALAGIPARISFDHTWFVDRWQPSFLGAAAGPFASVLLAWLGVLLWRRGGRLSRVGLALALVMPLTRLLSYVIFATVPGARIEVNDEGVMGLDCGVWPWTWALVLAPLLLAAWVALWRSIPWSTGRRAILFAAASAGWIAALSFELAVLEPRFFPDAQARELVMPGPPPAAEGAGRQP